LHLDGILFPHINDDVGQNHIKNNGRHFNQYLFYTTEFYLLYGRTNFGVYQVILRFKIGL